ncbi:MAG: hypothetical protein M1836_002242 [Candelina mexicana]|nr:MAG: hypothetical protein M1836_002242 [Candelina mexicana]
MDPFSVAGLGLGISSLIVQVFGGCVKGYELISNIQDMPENCQYLRVRLEIEQHRLLNWSQIAGLLDGDGEKLNSSLKLNRPLLLGILTEIKTTLENFGKLNGKYEDLRPMEEIYNGQNDSEANLSKLSLADSTSSKDTKEVVISRKSHNRFSSENLHALKKKAYDVVDAAPKVPRRLRWVTLDKDKFEALLKRLTELNGFMEGLMDDNMQAALQEAQHQTHLEILQLNTKVEDLLQLVAAMTIPVGAQQQAIVHGVPMSPTSVIMARQEEKQSLASLAKFKAYHTSIETEPSAEKSAMDSTELSQKDFEILTTDNISDQRAEAIYKDPNGGSQHVWIEWLDYELTYNPKPGPKPIIIDRVKQLAALLGSADKPKEFCAPHCLGYFDDSDASNPDEGNTRFGFVFSKPSNVPQSTTPTSLLSLFSCSPKPSLTKRIALARSVANSILYLHSVNWLHKGLRSHNIVFFVPSSPSSNPAINNISPSYTYLSGFDYARPARSEEMTEKPPENAEYDVYRHPSTHGDSPRTNYKKTFDIYSLGIVLLEIAYWQPIDKILSIPDLRTARPPVLHRIREQLLEEGYLSEVGGRMGDMYEEVVRACLEGPEAFGLRKDSRETSVKEGAVLQRAFGDRVVDVLKGMKL